MRWQVGCLIMAGSGGKSFCAGGDVQMIREDIGGGLNLGCEFGGFGSGLGEIVICIMMYPEIYEHGILEDYYGDHFQDHGFRGKYPTVLRWAVALG